MVGSSIIKRCLSSQIRDHKERLCWVEECFMVFLLECDRVVMMFSSVNSIINKNENCAKKKRKVKMLI